jgi:hypothetical protein
MAQGIQDLGTVGYLYKTAPDGTTIITTERNTVDGVRAMQQQGTANAPVVAARSAVGKITVSSVASAGSITNIDIAAVNQIGANIVVTSSTASVVATQIATAINAFTPASGDNYTAQAVGAVVSVFSSPASGSAANGLTITVSVTDITIVTTTTAFTNGSSQIGVYDTTFGYRFYINANYNGDAVPTSLTNAVEITEYMTVRGLQSGVMSMSLTVATDALTPVDRSSAISQIITTNQGGAGTDNLEYINPEKFAEGDIIFIRSVSSAQALTIVDASSATVTSTPNIYLTDGNNFVIQSNKVLMLRYTFSNSLGGIFIEMSRSISGGIVTLTRAQLLTLIGASGISVAQTYFVTDVGVAGILLTGTSSNSVSSDGRYLAVNPDYNNVSGDYSGTWYATMVAPTISDLYAYDGVMYSSVTGAVGTSPDGDTTNWLTIPFSDARYVREVDSIGYDLANNFIFYRKDKRGNNVSQSYQNSVALGVNAINYFQWGNDLCTDNIVDASAVYSANQDNQFIRNSFVNGSLWDAVTSATAVVNNNRLNNCPVVGNTYANFSDNVLDYVSISASTGTNFTENILSGCTIASNTTTNITNNTGYLTISSNTGCTINLNSGLKNWTTSIVNNLIALNTNSSLTGNNLIMATIGSNSGVTANFNNLRNGYLINNVNNNYPALPASSCLFAQLELKNEAKVDAVLFNTAGTIQRGVASGEYAVITNVLFDSSITIATVSAVQANLDMFTLDSMALDGGGTALSFQSGTLANPGGLYNTCEMGNNASGAWGYLNMAAAGVFAAGVLTVPIQNSHAGIIYLYGCNGQNVTSIVVTSNIRNRKKFPVTFVRVQGAGTVTFTPTALPLAGNQFGSSVGAEILTEIGDSYTVQKIDANYFRTSSLITL